MTDVSALAHSLSEVYDLNTFLYIRRYDLGGLMLLYAPGYRISPSFYLTINALLFIGSALIYKRLIVDRLSDGGSLTVAMLGLLGNPFFLLNMAGPNKELPLLLLTLLLAFNLTKKTKGWFWKSTLIAGLTTFFRDGYGMLLMIFVFVYYLGHIPRWRLPLPAKVIFICLAISAGAAIFSHSLAEWLPFVRRNLSVANLLPHDEAAGGAISATTWLDILKVFVQWGRHLVLNATSLALFPMLTQQSGSIYWIGVSYTIFGFLNLVACICAIFTLVSTMKADTNVTQQLDAWALAQILSVIWLGLFVLMSASAYVQPRYQMTILPIGVSVVALHTRHVRRAILWVPIVLALGFLATRYAHGVLPPTVPSDFFPVNPYIPR
ncbi:hypothetical protein [Herbaspirillum sp. AP21]|uniref:hypothetical protein n=1 Tax=Herbaspirillum sp. AP21 TaxID=2754073 RepID=UPI0015D9C69C|nr:hypothetical protein [Herbaspirillum sp. AP21]NZD70329.1 hypothetical protein [Herbaspirillum sp. AP21]